MSIAEIITAGESLCWRTLRFWLPIRLVPFVPVRHRFSTSSFFHNFSHSFFFQILTDLFFHNVHFSNVNHFFLDPTSVFLPFYLTALSLFLFCFVLFSCFIHIFLTQKHVDNIYPHTHTLSFCGIFFFSVNKHPFVHPTLSCL